MLGNLESQTKVTSNQTESQQTATLSTCSQKIHVTLSNARQNLLFLLTVPYY